MSCGVEVPLSICKGKTYSKVFRWGQQLKTYKPVASATLTAPCVMTVTAHGMPNGWHYQVAGAKGLRELNTARGKDRQAVVVGPDSIEVNELDATNLDAYEGGGVLSYHAPVDLGGYTARMHIRNSPDSAATVVELTSDDSEILLDNALGTITLQLSATATAALPTLTDAVYDLEMVSGAGLVYLLAYGSVQIEQEVTR